MKVKCLKSYSEINLDELDEKIKPIWIVGEALPEKGKIYDVKHEVHFSTKKYKNINGYVLEEFDFKVYGVEIAFDTKNFEIVEDEWENRFIYGNIYKTKEIIMVMELDIQVDWKNINKRND